MPHFYVFKPLYTCHKSSIVKYFFYFFNTEHRTPNTETRNLKQSNPLQNPFPAFFSGFDGRSEFRIECSYDIEFIIFIKLGVKIGVP